MPDLVVTITEHWMTIDGPLPEGYRLIVHNHSDNSDFYPYMREIRDCRYSSPAEELEVDDEEEGSICYLYVEESTGGAGS
jgi:hypothetical protein